MRKTLILTLMALSSLGLAQQPPALTQSVARNLFSQPTDISSLYGLLFGLGMDFGSFNADPYSASASALNELGRGSPVADPRASGAPYALTQPVSACRMYINPLASTSLTLTQVYAEAFNGAPSGSAIADCYVYLGKPAPGTEIPVVIRWSKIIPKGTQLYVRIRGDGPFGARRLATLNKYPQTSYPATSSCATAVIYTPSATWNNDASGSQTCLYCEIQDAPVLGPNSSGILASDSGTATSTTVSNNTTSDAITGWGGLDPNTLSHDCNAVEALIYPVQLGKAPTTARIVLTSGSITGPVMADVTEPIGALNYNVENTIRFVLPRPIPRGTRLYRRLMLDGRCGFRTISTVGTGEYKTDSSLQNTAWTATSSTRSVYWRNLLVDPTTRVLAPLSATANMQALTRTLFAPSIVLNSQFYVTSGHNLQIYSDAILCPPRGVPQSLYTVDYVCAKGAQYDGRWSFSPVDADAGALPLSVNVYFAGSLVATASTTINVSLAAQGTGVTRSWNQLGDSMTASGYQLAQMAGDSAAGVFHITTVGTQSVTVADFGATSRTVLHDGYSGQTSTWLATNAASPIVSAGVVNYSNYLTSHSLTMGSSDIVAIEIGTNDLFAQTDDVSALQAIATYLTNVGNIITSVHAYNAGIRVVILLPPSAPPQDAFGYSYGAGQIASNWKRNGDLLRQWAIATWDTAAMRTAKVYVLQPMVDTRNNWQTMTQTYNWANTATYSYPVNGVHPGPAGYYEWGRQNYDLATFLG